MTGPGQVAALPPTAGPRAAVVFVPGLTRTLVEEALPALGAWAARTRTAGVVPCFPCVPAAVQASVLCGQLPDRHGVRGPAWESEEQARPPLTATLFDRLRARDAAARGLAVEVHVVLAPTGEPPPGAPGHDDSGRRRAESAPADPERVQRIRRAWDDGATRLVVASLDGLARAMIQQGMRHASTLAAAGELDALLDDLLRHRPQGCTVLLCGAPAYAAVRALVPLQELAQRCGARAVRGDGALARFMVAPAGRVQARDRLLATSGVERVLDGDAPASWGCAPAEAGELVALAEPGWAFVGPEDAAPLACSGHPDASDAAEPLALWAADAVPPPWPPRAHDYRLGSTVARALGLSTEGMRDRPLPHCP